MQPSDKVYKYFAKLIFEKSGIHYPEKDFYRLDSRLNTLCESYGCKDYDELYTLYSTNMTSLMERDLINLATNNETYFFRDKKPFEYLRNHVFKTARESGQPTVNIWSCACSSGQEPYSIVMTFLDEVQNNFKLEVFASDISSKILDRAQEGVYSSLEVQRGLPVQNLVKYFEKGDNSWSMKKELKDKITFGFFNILKDVYPVNKYDVIFCRNVLIYQDKENKQIILDNLYQALKPGGCLIFGAGESLIGFETGFKSELNDGLMCFVKPDQSIKKAA